MDNFIITFVSGFDITLAQYTETFVGTDEVDVRIQFEEKYGNLYSVISVEREYTEAELVW